ncbi:type II toxin-antitoxin system VapC family toxin [Labrys wisconsinensis]|uniref:Ribonuclease VapC n=1 Tax=Labrys wisconsinensis TaxID=425677 RepID=A0ABU0JC72_9HYPH|nr:type II toxin-antitoxin system VapC family toxin [Labrys wisconsinensis]MDQ0471879.1 putative nucleic acid-binding protein [Labrys wisconsinensis]
MAILVDTNVLLRRTQPDHESHISAIESVALLLASGEPVHFAPQNIAEFWNVATRPAINNGLGLSTVLTLAEVTKIEQALILLPDLPTAYAEWKRLVAAHGVIGAKVHDARLVATMIVHGVDRILTFNTGDFARFPVSAVHPASILAAPPAR